MFWLDSKLTVYPPHGEAFDERMDINGLELSVKQSIDLYPFASAVFVFGNRRRNRVTSCCGIAGFWRLLTLREADRLVWVTSNCGLPRDCVFRCWRYNHAGTWQVQRL